MSMTLGEYRELYNSSAMHKAKVRREAESRLSRYKTDRAVYDKENQRLTAIKTGVTALAVILFLGGLALTIATFMVSGSSNRPQFFESTVNRASLVITGLVAILASLITTIVYAYTLFPIKKYDPGLDNFVLQTLSKWGH